MRRNTLLVVAIAGVISLGGCSMLGFGKDTEKAAAEAEAVAESFAPVERVVNIEIGRTRNGAAVTANGVAPGLGFSSPELRARREGKPGPDGFLDFDFVARAPDPGFAMGEGVTAARMVRADVLLSPRELQGVRGIRVHGVSGGLLMNF